MIRAFHVAIRRLFKAPLMRRLFTNTWYSLVSNLDKQAAVTFLNYGCAYPDEEEIALEPVDETNRYPIQLYHLCAEAMRRVEAYLKLPATGLASKDRNNLRFYVAMHAVVSLSGKREPSALDLAKLDVTRLDDAAIAKSLDVVKTDYESLGGNDQVAKGPSLLEVALTHL